MWEHVVAEGRSRLLHRAWSMAVSRPEIIASSMAERVHVHSGFREHLLVAAVKTSRILNTYKIPASVILY